MKIAEFIEAEIERLEAEGEYMPDELDGICLKIAQKYGTKPAFSYIGGFSSPGYDVECYAFAYVEDGEVTIHGYEHESK